MFQKVYFGNTVFFNIFHPVHSEEFEEDDISDNVESHASSEDDNDVESGFSSDNSDLEINHDHFDSLETLQELGEKFLLKMKQKFSQCKNHA